MAPKSKAQKEAEEKKKILEERKKVDEAAREAKEARLKVMLVCLLNCYLLACFHLFLCI